MRLLNKLLFMLFLLSVITSCDDTASEASEVNPPKPPTVFWEDTHLSIIGWKGAAKSVVESSFMDLGDSEAELISSVEWNFDKNGHLTYYNPVKMDTEMLVRDVWQTLACYSYSYDESGRMIEAIVDDFSGSPIVYKLTYGDYDAYVPLIFPLGTFEFFLVKGLESIVSADGKVSYHFDGHQASYTTESWMGVETTIYEYEANGIFPIRKRVTLSRGGVVGSSEVTSYTYNEDGSLSSLDKILKEGEAEVERTIVHNAPSSLLPVTKITDAGGMSFDWIYQYDNENRLKTASYIENKNSDEEMINDISYLYSHFDGLNNWTQSVQHHRNTIGGELADDYMVNVYREIDYH